MGVEGIKRRNKKQKNKVLFGKSLIPDSDDLGLFDPGRFVLVKILKIVLVLDNLIDG